MIVFGYLAIGYCVMRAVDVATKALTEKTDAYYVIDPLTKFTMWVWFPVVVVISIPVILVCLAVFIYKVVAHGRKQ